SSSWIARRSWAWASHAAATPARSSAAPRTSWAFVNVTKARSRRPVLPYRVARFRNAQPRPWREARASSRWKRSRASRRKASARSRSSRFAAKTPAARRACARIARSPLAFAKAVRSIRAIGSAYATALLGLSVGLPGPSEASDRFEDPIDILRTDPGMNGEFEEPRDQVLRDRAATADPEVLEGLLLVQGHRVRGPAADASLVQDPDDLVTGDGEVLLATDDVLVVGMHHPIAFRRGREALDFLEAFRQGLGVRPTLLHPAVELPQLNEADRRGDLGHAVVVAEEGMLILRHLPVVPEQTRF